MVSKEYRCAPCQDFAGRRPLPLAQRPECTGAHRTWLDGCAWHGMSPKTAILLHFRALFCFWTARYQVVGIVSRIGLACEEHLGDSSSVAPNLPRSSTTAHFGAPRTHIASREDVALFKFQRLAYEGGATLMQSSQTRKPTISLKAALLRLSHLARQRARSFQHKRPPWACNRNSVSDLQ
jgi:hypothetical protein